MRHLPAFLMMALLAVMVNGCGTITTFVDGDPRVYGGVKKDREWLEDFVNGGGTETPLSNSDPRGPLFIVAAIALLEPPLSFIADTLTLPYTWYRSRQNAIAAVE